MPRLAQYLGRWILHSGWYPDRKVRLFHRRKAQWVGDYVHESVMVEGSVGHLKSNILHFTCSSLSEHLKTMDRYTTLAAEQLVDQKTPVGWTRAGSQPGLDLLQNLRDPARISGWHGRSRHCKHGGAVQFLEVRQSQEHEPAQVASS